MTWADYIAIVKISDMKKGYVIQGVNSKLQKAG